ncbi:hypothetical protein [Ferruginibacter sp. HRS2-29]|uniref:hypothetical protein n=1 Tax=Ferruginibacter sp. HRS2-29 TaxID=2487334 RepID=UPI0020CF2962|nr:hypothetical protein [Ferruginibacter sp. HRS2-29]MCP9750171.1 hypothetical protein [Ferruginibacter sp. HRS2-29]
MPYKDFLEDFPLFKKYKAKFWDALNNYPKPAINMNCQSCKSLQTFSMTNEFFDLKEYINYPAAGCKVRLEYLCQSCRNFTREFFIYISSNLDYIYKIGQYPEWEIKIDKNLELTLGKHLSVFKKGLVCESQGYGIGAFAYYRRITENIIDELLDSISELIETGDREKYKAALILTKKTRVTQEKIDLVKDLLPTVLRPNGMNPLGVLHSELSEGIHSETDENCLEVAGHVREILTFLCTQIILSKQTAKNFTNSMQALLNKKK